MKIRMVAAILLIFLARTAAAELPDLNITLGDNNEGAGLEVSSAGDGENEATVIGGKSARHKSGPGLYLYFAVSDPAYAPGPRDVFVTAEVFDNGVGFLELSYDAANDSPNIHTKYSRATPALMINCGRWREIVFHLPDLRVGHGQNFGADFRFALRDFAIHRVTVSPHPPKGYDPDAPVDAESLRLLGVNRPAGMEVTFGNDATPATAAIYHALGVSSIESYVTWSGVEPEKGKWDWSKWDKQVGILQKAKLKWVPFLIAGPAYATPLWFQHSTNSHVFRCLEHSKNSAVQSIFNPDLRPQVERFVRAFADKYKKTGVIESLLLGISGIYGESIYAAGPEGGWTAELTGDYHNHHGWWAADEFAVAAFRDAMKKKYGTIAALNAAWTTNNSSFDNVRTFLPGKAPGDRSRADFVEWYQQAMTEWASFWVKTVRDTFPKTEIYLCTGGDGDPSLGADFTAQAKAIARFHAGIRITNEGSDYAHNFSVTRDVATATRFYETFCGFEPASGVTPAGNIARIYNASATGARQLHCYNNNVLDNNEPRAVELWRKNISWLAPRKPRMDVALYEPRETWAIDAARKTDFYDLSRRLRDATDHDYVTRLSVADGALHDHRVLVLAAAPVLEPAAADAIEKWVRKGGTLIAATRPGEIPGSRLYVNAAWRERMFADCSSATNLFRLSCDPAPAHWELSVGHDDDASWIFGEWHDREKRSMWGEIEGATMRWTGAHPGAFLPVKPGADYSLRISAYIPGEAFGGTAICVRINSHEIGRIEHDGKNEFEFRVAANDLGSSTVARLEMDVKAWQPSQKEHSGDLRWLGIAVRQIEWIRAGAENQPAGNAALRFEVDRESLEKFSRSVGKGRTIYLPGLMPDVTAIARIIASQIPDLVDGEIDNRFATRTDDGILWFDAGNSKIEETKHQN